MRVFVTGATGFIGSATVKDLIAAGHTVVGLARSQDKAKALIAAGAEVLLGSVQDPGVLKDGVGRSDGVVHTAFSHDFARYQANCEDDRRVIETLGSLLAGSDRPLIVTSGTGLAFGPPGRASNEDDPAASSTLIPRAATEEAALAVAQKGVNVSIMRLPQVHDTVKQGLVTFLIAIAREKKVSGYVGDGSNRWAAAHVTDVARLYRLAFEKAQRGAVYHAVAEAGVPVRKIAEIVGRKLGVVAASVAPEQVDAHFGWMAVFARRDALASSELTRKRLGWNPTGPDLLTDLENMREEDL